MPSFYGIRPGFLVTFSFIWWLILVKCSIRRVWIAGLKTEVSISSRIQYGEEVYLSNFFSKKLQKPFPK